MNLVPLFKATAGLATSLGAGVVVGNAIKATTPTNMKTASKVLAAVGSVALSGIAGDMAAKYIEDQIQGLADGFTLGRKLGKKKAERDNFADYAQPEGEATEGETPTSYDI